MIKKCDAFAISFLVGFACFICGDIIGEYRGAKEAAIITKCQTNDKWQRTLIEMGIGEYHVIDPYTGMAEFRIKENK